MSDERCIPPEELRGDIGEHRLTHVDEDEPDIIAKWHGWKQEWHSFLIYPVYPEELYAEGWRYVCPIPNPSELAAAKEREAALVGAAREAATCFTSSNRVGIALRAALAAYEGTTP